MRLYQLFLPLYDARSKRNDIDVSEKKVERDKYNSHNTLLCIYVRKRPGDGPRRRPAALVERRKVDLLFVEMADGSATYDLYGVITAEQSPSNCSSLEALKMCFL